MLLIKQVDKVKCAGRSQQVNRPRSQRLTCQLSCSFFEDCPLPARAVSQAPIHTSPSPLQLTKRLLHRLALPTNKLTSSRTRKTKKRTRAMSVAAPAIPPKPSTPATIATIKKTTAQYNIDQKSSLEMVSAALEVTQLLSVLRNAEQNASTASKGQAWRCYAISICISHEPIRCWQSSRVSSSSANRLPKLLPSDRPLFSPPRFPSLTASPAPLHGAMGFCLQA